MNTTKIIASLLATLSLRIGIIFNHCYAQQIDSTKIKMAAEDVKKGWETINRIPQTNLTFGQAENNFSLATKEDPKNIEAWFGLGYCLSQMNQHQESIEAYTKAIQIDSTYANIFMNRGLEQAKTRNYSQAVADYDRVLKLDAQNRQAHFNKAEALKSASRL